jgi:membrane protease YdiL (CAAX protease family)
LQPRLGIPITTLTFAAVNAQFPLAPSLLLIIALGLVLGIQRQRANTTACIITHAAFNLLIVVVMPLLSLPAR